MTNTKNRFKSLVELRRHAVRHVIGEHPSVGAGPRDALPVPIRREGQVQIAFMFYFFAFGPVWSRIHPPDKVVWLDPISGHLIGEDSVTPEYFGQTDPANRFIEKKVFSSLGDTEDLDDLEERLYILYDILLAVWATNSSAPGSNKLQNEAHEFLKIFSQISEIPLRPYYEYLGRDWFGWLRALAQ